MRRRGQRQVPRASQQAHRGLGGRPSQGTGCFPQDVHKTKRLGLPSLPYVLKGRGQQCRGHVDTVLWAPVGGAEASRMGNVTECLLGWGPTASGLQGFGAHPFPTCHVSMQTQMHSSYTGSAEAGTQPCNQTWASSPALLLTLILGKCPDPPSLCPKTSTLRPTLRYSCPRPRRHSCQATHSISLGRQQGTECKCPQVRDQCSGERHLAELGGSG